MKLKNPVDLIIINEKMQILIAKRSPLDDEYANIWSIPWGTAEVWESIEETITREIKEELWCKIKWMKYFTSHFLKISDEIGSRAFYFYWEIDGEIKLNPELIEYKWIDLNSKEIENIEMAYDQDIILKKFKKFLNF